MRRTRRRRNVCRTGGRNVCRNVRRTDRAIDAITPLAFLLEAWRTPFCTTSQGETPADNERLIELAHECRRFG